MTRCFSRPQNFVFKQQGWLPNWQRTYGDHELQLSSGQQEALATVLPILLCGEQSAMAAFHASARKLHSTARCSSYRLFGEIVQDECQHDLGLSQVQSKLPVVAGMQDTRRGAKLFFARLGRCHSTAAHFARISSLDSGVAIIMRALEGGSIAADHQLKNLFRLIKQDEARHVFISRNHAFMLGYSRADFAEGGALVRHQLVELLFPFGNQFELLGVDADGLFKRLNRSGEE